MTGHFPHFDPPSFEILITVAMDTEDENTSIINYEQYALSFTQQGLGATCYIYS